jgi:Flp pilus assembly protein TadG
MVVRREIRPVARRRSGTAVVELALLLPLLVFLFLVAADFARIFYFSLTLTNCARAGALYASDPATMGESPFSTVQAAALADATNLAPQPTITQTSGTDAAGRAYVEVRAAHTFNTITGFPGIPSSIQLQRSVRMYVAAVTPSTS